MPASTYVGSAQSVLETDLAFICDRANHDLRALEHSEVLVTGGGGFLGYYLVQALLYWNEHHAARPMKVTVVDNWLRGRPSWLQRHSSRNDLRIETLDVTKPWPSDVPLGDWTVHAASIASPTFYRERPIETMDANVGGLRRLMDLCVDRTDKPAKGILFFSSSEVYGDPTPDAIPTAEDYPGRVSFTGPRACYDESKRFGETLAVNFATQRGVPISSVRPFNNYGPGLKLTDRRVIPDFVNDILENRNILMYSSGTPTRTFCYVADAVVGYLGVLVRGRRGEAYNIGTDVGEISMRALAEKLVGLAADEFGYEGTVEMATSQDTDYLTDNPDRRCPDISKARSQLGFDPVIDLDEGLRRSLRWYRGIHAGWEG